MQSVYTRTGFPSIAGFVVNGLPWLALIGLVLFVATGVWGG
ncbi:hypothetical protein ACFFGR_07770 [Arthrobacter liuii]